MQTNDIMPDLKRGMVVRSIAGRDKDRLMVVAEVTDDRTFVIDGKERPIQRPKRKNPKHIARTEDILPEELLRFNNPLRKALNKLTAEKRLQQRSEALNV